MNAGEHNRRCGDLERLERAGYIFIYIIKNNLGENRGSY